MLSLSVARLEYIQVFYIPNLLYIYCILSSLKYKH